MNTLRYCNIKNLNNILSFNRHPTLGFVVTGFGYQRNYSKKKDSCCKEISQTEGRTVEPWPKSQMWPCKFPNEPQPPNYDPYKIRSPDVVVPPLPPSNVKRTGFVYVTSTQEQGPEQGFHRAPHYSGTQSDEVKTEEEYVKEEEESPGFFGYLKNMLGWGKKGRGEGEETPNTAQSEKLGSDDNRGMEMSSNAMKSLFQKTHMVHPDNWKPKSLSQMQKLNGSLSQENAPRLGYHGRDKYKYAFHEPWNPLDRLTLLAQAERDECYGQHAPTCEANKGPMLDCARLKGPCSVRTVPDPPPCPPPPPPPFPWIYVWSVASFMGIMGLIYKLYLWNENRIAEGENVPIWRPRRVIRRPFHEEDLPPCVQYLIIGAGAAGWAAYSAIMEHDKKAKVFFITKEDILPYKRFPMSKHMWWNPEPPDVKNLYYVQDWKRKTMYESECRNFKDPVKFYRMKSGPAVSIATGWCVIRVDADDHVVYVKTLCGEQPIYYERCLLAPGSKPKLLSMFKTAPKPVRDRVCALRDIRDLEKAYRSVKAAKHVVIIGGGPLGCELAWYLGRMNKLDKELDPEKEPIEIVHIYKDKGILSSIIPEYLGEWAAEKIKNEGVTVKPKLQVYDAFQSADGRLELTLSDGSSVVTDYAFLAVGAEPRVELAEPSYLEVDDVNGGFLVNTELEARTHLYVAGDAASLYSQWKDTRIRMDHYLNAIEQGHVAGANMTGYWIPSNMEPHYWVTLEDQLQMEVVGEVGGCMPTIGIFKQCPPEDEDTKTTTSVETGGGDRPCYKKTDEYKNRYLRGMLMYMRDDTVVGFAFWNMPPIEDRSAVATEILRAKPSYKDIDVLADLLGFVGTKCIYKEDEKAIERGPCIKNFKTW